jgi:hypothetical protein
VAIVPHSPSVTVRAATMAALVAVLWCTSAGCRSPAVTARSIEPAAFQQRLVDRERITPGQARCVGDQVFGAYDDAAIRTISEQGVIALPSPRWAPYTYAMVECVMGDELAVPVASTPAGTRP